MDNLQSYTIQTNMLQEMMASHDELPVTIRVTVMNNHIVK